MGLTWGEFNVSWKNNGNIPQLRHHPKGKVSAQLGYKKIVPGVAM